jgi:hypothetical protein
MALDYLPRVNFETMQHHAGRRVLLVGEVKNLQAGGVTLRTSDDGEVLVQTSAHSGATSWTESQFVEVCGSGLNCTDVQR